MMRQLAAIPLLCLAAAAACSSAETFAPLPQLPSEAQGLRLDGAISTPVVTSGQTALLSFSLQNLTDEAVRLDFNSGCQITPHIETTGGKIVSPPGGSYLCTAAITSLTLPPRGEHIVVREVLAADFQIAILTSVPLPKGRYRAYAILNQNSRGLLLRSTPVEFEVR